MVNALEIAICKKDNLVDTITGVLQRPDFCGSQTIQTERITELLDKILDTVVFAVEFPYVDKHYRDSYYFYHSTKLERLGRDCIRVHLFEKDITREQIFSYENHKTLEDFYLGFFIIRPLVRFPIGRSIVSPRAFKNQHFLCCLTKIPVCLFGQKLRAIGFPHVAQDTETHSCAESSLWSLLEYYGTKYSHYRPLLPSQILESISSMMTHRQLPSQGLTVQELANGLNANGHPCLVYAEKNPKTGELMERDFALMSIYLESGIPVIVALQNAAAGHAVMAIGHQELDYADIAAKATTRTWTEASEFRQAIVLIDDNLPPYSIATIHEPASNYTDKSFQGMKISSFLVPLQRHMHLDAGPCYDLIEDIFNHKKIGLAKSGSGWITRLFLTGGHSFKEFILRDSLLDDKLRVYLLSLSFPKFIWCCELYDTSGYQTGRAEGLLVIDATGGNSLASVLLYWLKDKRFIHDGTAWLGFKPILNFRINSYKNNLKGAWNKWQNE